MYLPASVLFARDMTIVPLSNKTYPAFMGAFSLDHKMEGVG